ncbi:MAG: sigma-70 family RNA polymerase sigma factor [Muribaculaceae bacterium]|nr:sigma-70 family RNA polymerase sigma factor [Muribaculaceae bacterium]MDE6352379.1 sigma-70 family RNA polymerase sigma factor [Muribaculaceae bacterium]MDE6643737.1 sigma-70 family RNA polymerase sigma factor [Muribaculaceae bacterium]
MTADEFKTVFLPCHQQLYRVAYRLTGNREDAEDIVQETYLKMWNIRDRLDQLDNPVAFCMTTLKNLFVDFLRRKRGDGSPDVNVEDVTIPSDADIGNQIEQRDSVNIVTQLIELLPGNQRDIIRMRDIADLPFEEIEAATGLSPGNIRTLLSRARKKIKEQYIALLKYERK